MSNLDGSVLNTSWGSSAAALTSCKKNLLPHNKCLTHTHTLSLYRSLSSRMVTVHETLTVASPVWVQLGTAAACHTPSLLPCFLSVSVLTHFTNTGVKVMIWIDEVWRVFFFSFPLSIERSWQKLPVVSCKKEENKVPPWFKKAVAWLSTPLSYSGELGL